MFTRFLITLFVLTVLVSACVPASTDVFEVGVEPAENGTSTEAIKEELHPIVQAMLGGNIGDQLAQIQYTSTACSNVEGLGAPPRCPEGVAEGTPVEAFPMLGSEGGFVKPEEMEQVLNNLWVKNLYAVYRVTPNPNLESYIPQGEYALLFERNVNDLSTPVTLLVTDGKVVRIDYSMGPSAADLLEEIPVGQVIVGPQQAASWTEK